MTLDHHIPNHNSSRCSNAYSVGLVQTSRNMRSIDIPHQILQRWGDGNREHSSTATGNRFAGAAADQLAQTDAYGTRQQLR